MAAYEKEKRKREVDEARCNVRLSGTVLTPEIEAINKRYIDGEISSDEHRHNPS